MVMGEVEWHFGARLGRCVTPLMTRHVTWDTTWNMSWDMTRDVTRDMTRLLDLKRHLWGLLSLQGLL